MKKMKVICNNCGKEFDRIPSAIKRSKHQFCSKECETKYRTGKPNLKARKQQIVECDYCGREFAKHTCYIKRSKSDYCSRECFTKGTSKSAKLTCRNCNKTFYRVNSQIIKSVHFFFCCHNCYVKWHRGENHILWEGGISPYPPEFNDELKLKVRNRDNFTCQECNHTENELGYVLRAHHIDYDKTHTTTWIT